MGLATLLTSTIRISMPYGAGALGGTLSERVGVVNIALEGLMLSGAFAYVVTAWSIEKHFGPHAVAFAPLAGLLAGMLAGIMLSVLLALATVTFRADNIISGLALNMLAYGGTNFLLLHVFGSSSNSARCPTFSDFTVAAPDSRLAFVNHLANPLIILMAACFILAHFLMYRTRLGLRMRAVGENPAAADSLGISVTSYRYCGVLLGGAVASLGGVWLASDQGLFSSGMTNGRGYIALAAVIVGNWKPFGAATACLIFGFSEALKDQVQIYSQQVQNMAPEATNWLQRLAGNTPPQLIQALPYVLTIVVIAGLIGRTTPPAADGIPFEKQAS